MQSLIQNMCKTPLYELSTFIFTFMHLADAFIQSDLHCIQVSTFYQLLLSQQYIA